MGREVSSCEYGEKYQGFSLCRPSSIQFIFFIRVTMSSWLRSDTKLPVMRGADGIPSELSWESWGQRVALGRIVCNIENMKKIVFHIQKCLWVSCKLFCFSLLLMSDFLIINIYSAFTESIASRNCDSLTALSLHSGKTLKAMGSKWGGPLLAANRRWSSGDCYSGKPLPSRKTQGVAMF